MMIEWFEAHAVVVTQVITMLGILYNIFKTRENIIRTHELHFTFNSKMDAALKTQREAGIAEGIQQEREAQMERDRVAKHMLVVGVISAAAWAVSIALS